MFSPTESSRTRRRARWLAAIALVAASWAAAPAWAQEAPSPEADAALQAEVDELFRTLRLRDSLLLEPRSDMNGIAAIEIVDGSFIIDGESVPPSALDERLGSAGDVVRRLGELEARRRHETFGGERSPRARRAPPPPAAPEPARPPRRRSRSRTDSQVVIGESVVIEADEESRDVLVFGGNLTIHGQVIGDAVAIGGSVYLEQGGEVTGDLSAIGGRANLAAGSEVHGNVISVGKDVVMDDAAHVGGQVTEVPFGPQIVFGRGFDDWNWDWDWEDDWWMDDRGWRVGRFIDLFGQFFWVMLLALLACATYLLLSGPIERMEGLVRAEPWKAFLVGLLAFVLFLILVFGVCAILILSIVGCILLPFVLFVVLAAMLVMFVGGTAVALRLGRWSGGRFGWNLSSPYLAIIVGVAIIQVASFTAAILDLGPFIIWPLAVMIGFLGALVQCAVTLMGLGAVVLTRFGTTDGLQTPPPGSLPPIPETDGPQAETPPDLEWDEPEGTEEPWEPEVEAPGDEDSK